VEYKPAEIAFVQYSRERGLNIFEVVQDLYFNEISAIVILFGTCG